MEQTTTDKLMDILKSASNSVDYLDAIESKQESFSQSAYFNRLFQIKNISKSEVIKRSLLDQYYAYQIFRGDKIPSRGKILLLAFAFPLDVKQTQTLLYVCKAEKLYIKDKRDSIILFATEKQYSLEEANDLLTELGERPLL